MWLIVDKEGIHYEIGTESTTLEQALAEMLWYHIKSINDIVKIEYVGKY